MPVTVQVLWRVSATICGPAAGTSVPTGSTVTLQIVSGFTTAPNVVNQPVAQATRTLSGLGLTAQITQQPAPGHAAGTVLSQSPSGGARIARGGQVALVVVQGSPSPTPTPSKSATPSPTKKPGAKPSASAPSPPTPPVPH